MPQLHLALENAKNRRLVKRALPEDLELREGCDGILAPPASDAYLLDSSSLKKYHRELRRIKRECEPVFVPAMLLASSRGSRNALEHLGETVDDVLEAPVKSAVLRNRLRNLLHTRELSRRLDELNAQLEEKVRRRTRTIREREEDVIQHLVSAAHYRDEETGNHIRRLGLFASIVSDELGWDPSRSDDLRLAASLHDIGKIGIPDAILHKPGELSEEEFETIKTHTTIGARILQNTAVPMLELARTIAHTHHERWDGSGYPRGLAGEQIPLAGRIVAVVDVYDALTNERVYRDPLPEEEAVAIIREDCGSHFDPQVVEAFRGVRETLREAGEEYRER